jgi:hypothetical protein
MKEVGTYRKDELSVLAGSFGGKKTSSRLLEEHEDRRQRPDRQREGGSVGSFRPLTLAWL